MKAIVNGENSRVRSRIIISIWFCPLMSESVISRLESSLDKSANSEIDADCGTAGT